MERSIRTKLGWAAAGVGLFLAGSLVYREFSKYSLSGKVVLITGGSRGLGLALARQMALKGAKLAICSRSSDRVALAQQELEANGAEVMGITADVTSEKQVKDMIRDIIHRFGRIDVVVNNAGTLHVGPYETMGLQEYEEAMKVHFWGPLYIIQTVLPHFHRQGEGRIVNITSIGGKIAVPHLLPYTASKFALVGLSEGLHAELKKHHIHVTTIVPNLVRTGSPRNIAVKGDHEAEYAWFKLSDSNPVLAQSVEVAVRRIVKAIEYGESEAILSVSAKLLTIVKGLAPGWMNSMVAVANQFLPDNVAGGDETKRGYQVESSLSQGPVGSLSDRAAEKNNEF